MSASGPSVLVVDDHPPLREVVGEVLERAGCRVRLAATGEQALEVARREPVAASFLDVHMPGLDGFETALRLRRIRHDMPLVFVTASTSETSQRLLSDTEDTVAAAYGVRGLGGFYSKRWTFYIDSAGIIREIDKNVDVESAGQDIARKLSELGFPKSNSGMRPADE